MILLDKSQCADAFEVYRSIDAFFPLIGAVLLGEQIGVAFADNARSPRQWYVEHRFGFAQTFGTAVPNFESDLERYILVQRGFVAPKARIYTPLLPNFLNAPTCDGFRSIRQRFVFARPPNESVGNAPDHSDELDSIEVDAKNIADVERRFGIVSRFWRNSDDFVRNANAVLTLRQGEIAAICYAAAVADRRAEIDVFTLPEFRAHGVGRFTVARFLDLCRRRSLQPLWDCFTNNAGSMHLCRSVGFTAQTPPYPFFTISKQ
jgi:GNAT superfamily N-acetyltransferase